MSLKLFNMQRANFCLVLLCILSFSCQQVERPSSHTYIHSIIDSLPLNKTKNILIYTINPNDCISCIYGFKAMNKEIEENGNGRLYVISVDRLIEKNALSKKIKDIDFFPENNKAIIWDKKIYDGINVSVGKNLPSSMVFVYDPRKDSILYFRIIREVSDYKELRKALCSAK